MITFDIETAALPNAIDFVGTPKAPSNYKDPVKIAEYVAEKSAAELEHAPLDPDLCTVRAIGTSINGTVAVNIVGERGMDERDLLVWFWGQFAGQRGVCCGYNILSFDFPVLLHRSMEWAVPVPMPPSLARYRIGPVYDLYAILYNWGPGRGLKWVANRFGLDVKSPGDSGSDVAGMDYERLRAYLNSEISLLEQLYQRMEPVYFGGRTWERP